MVMQSMAPYGREILGLPAFVKRALVLGASRSGLAATSALAGQGVHVVLSDVAAIAPEHLSGIGEDRLARVQAVVGPQTDELLDDIDLVVKSPGIPGQAPIVVSARARGVPVWSEIELGFRLLGRPLHAVTGTNGKTTTTALLGHIFATAGCEVQVLGNIGTALCTAVGYVGEETELVVEVSSFQLEDVEEFRPCTAILLNLTQDHLDRHGDIQSYLGIKARIFARQEKPDVAVLNADDKMVRSVGEALAERRRGPQVVWFSPGGDRLADSRYEGGRLVLLGRKSLSAAELSLKGLHNVENCLAAASAALAWGLPVDAVEESLRTFAGVAHRLQPAGKVRGVQYVNDSKATNVEATLKALTAYPAGVHLILGGRDKASDYMPLARACLGVCRAVYLIGEAAPLIRAAFEDVARKADIVALPQVVDAGDLERAVYLAAEAARPGEVVLLAPACASFDQYRNYEERGHHFMSLVAELASREGELEAGSNGGEGA